MVFVTIIVADPKGRTIRRFEMSPAVANAFITALSLAREPDERYTIYVQDSEYHV